MVWILRLLDTPGSAPSLTELPSTGVAELGRYPPCAVLCLHPAVSGKHCVLQCFGPEQPPEVEDRSTNGTFLNGMRLEKGKRRALSAGDVLSLATPGSQAPGNSDAGSGIAFRIEVKEGAQQTGSVGAGLRRAHALQRASASERLACALRQHDSPQTTREPAQVVANGTHDETHRGLRTSINTGTSSAEAAMVCTDTTSALPAAVVLHPAETASQEIVRTYHRSPEGLQQKCNRVDTPLDLGSLPADAEMVSKDAAVTGARVNIHAQPPVGESYKDADSATCSQKKHKRATKRTRVDDDVEVLPENLSSEALLARLMARRAARGVVASDTLGPPPCPKTRSPSPAKHVTSLAKDIKTTATGRLGAHLETVESRHQAHEKLKEQISHFALVAANKCNGSLAESEPVLVPAPQAFPEASFQDVGRKRRGRTPAPAIPDDSQPTLVLPPTKLPVQLSVAARATDAWDVVGRAALAEAGRAHRRAVKALAASTSGSKTTQLSFAPWRKAEASLEVAELAGALEGLRHRLQVEPGRRALMRRHGGQPRAGLFEDPPQGSTEAKAAVEAVQEGWLPACSTGNELEAAVFLPALGAPEAETSQQSLAALLDAARPGFLGAWQPLPSTAKIGTSSSGWKDLLSCARASRAFCIGTSGCFVGRLAMEGLTLEQPFAPAGGLEHCVCKECGEWVARVHASGHHLRCKARGQPGGQDGVRDVDSGRLLWKVFHQISGAGLGQRLRFRHFLARPPCVEISVEAKLEAALHRAAWACTWEPLHVNCQWRLTRRQCSTNQSDVVFKLSQPQCSSVPGQPCSFLRPLTPAQLVLLGWLRQQEAVGCSGSRYVVREVLRETLCESDLALELLLERHGRGPEGGLLILGGADTTTNITQSASHAGIREEIAAKAAVACLLALIVDDMRDICSSNRSLASIPNMSRGRCRLNTQASIVVTQPEGLARWQDALERLVDPKGVKILIISNHTRMRSVTVADVIAADLILVSVQLFSSEAYQRHFDQLSKPGLQVWDAASVRRRSAAAAVRRLQQGSLAGVAEEPVDDASVPAGDASELAAAIETLQPDQAAGHGEAIETSKPDHAGGDDDTEHGELLPGALVQLHGLSARPELNGRRARLLRLQEDSGRWSCRLLCLTAPKKAPSKTEAQGTSCRGRRGRRQARRQVVNVRPGNLQSLARRKRRIKVSKLASQPIRKRPRKAERAAPLEPAPALKISRYYAELRSREDYLSRRQVDLERRTLRLLREAAGAAADPAAAAEAARGLGAGPALLEMFRFRRLVLDECDVPAKLLGQLVVSGSSSSITMGASSSSLAQYLSTAALLYALHSLDARSRWAIASSSFLRSPGRGIQAAEAVAQLACLLGVHLPWCDPAEAQRFLEAWAAEVVTQDGIGGFRSCDEAKKRSEAAGVLQDELVLTDLSAAEWVIYLFYKLERHGLEHAEAPAASATRRIGADQERLLLLQCCSCLGEGENVAPGEGPAAALRSLLQRLEATLRERGTEARAAAARQADFELRLRAKQVLEGACPGNDREVLLACAHGSTLELRSLFVEGTFSVGSVCSLTLEAQLRRMAQAAAEGQGVVVRENAAPRNLDKDLHEEASPGDAALDPLPHLVKPGLGCQGCSRLLGHTKEALARLRLTAGRMSVAVAKATQRLRLARSLAAAAGMLGLQPIECALGPMCSDQPPSAAQGSRLMLLACGHICHEACLPQPSSGNVSCPCCQAAMRGADAAVHLEDHFPRCVQTQPKAEVAAGHSSRVSAVANCTRALLSDPGGRALQVLVFAIFPSVLCELSRALADLGSAVMSMAVRRKGGSTAEGARVLLLNAELLLPSAAKGLASDASKCLEPHVAVRHVILVHPLPGHKEVDAWEHRIVEFAASKVAESQIVPAVHIHRFATRNTVEESLVDRCLSSRERR
eukprot:TRINITY_DN23790_c0_g1_i1.p1 TRINITY_DN23790_c0_g1~~TRINITY_DN23790_c0_g1_i1.p1  ORF type:complete len:1916 (+),score=366.35 TRINITY_DN23790_c0_g1_i1:46-5793(+)